MIRAILLACVLDPMCDLHIWSLKTAQDFSAFERLCVSFRGGRDPATVARCVAMLEWLAEDEFPRREREGWSRLIVRVLDETHFLFPRDPRALPLVETIVQVGRSAGVFLVVATHHRLEAVPPSIVDQLDSGSGCASRAAPRAARARGERRHRRCALRSPHRKGDAYATGEDDEPALIHGRSLDAAEPGVLARAPRSPRALPSAPQCGHAPVATQVAQTRLPR